MFHVPIRDCAARAGRKVDTALQFRFLMVARRCVCHWRSWTYHRRVAAVRVDEAGLFHRIASLVAAVRFWRWSTREAKATRWAIAHWSATHLTRCFHTWRTRCHLQRCLRGMAYACYQRRRSELVARCLRAWRFRTDVMIWSRQAPLYRLMVRCRRACVCDVTLLPSNPRLFVSVGGTRSHSRYTECVSCGVVDVVAIAGKALETLWSSCASLRCGL